MKICDVKAVHPEAPGAPADWRSSLGQIAVSVRADDGTVGIGVGGGGAAGVHIVNAVLRGVLLRKDAGDIEAAWQEMYRATLPFGRKGLAIMAISGVDLALWDLKGKREGKSIVELLGGSREASVPAYKTVWSAEDAIRGATEGFRAIKLHLGSVQSVAQVRETRKAVGPEMEVMADAFMKWDVETTLSAAQKMAECDLKWLEEPLPPDDLEGYARLRDESAIAIAGGEHEFTAEGFRPLIEQALHAVVQPDVCWCGGLTELLKIYELAENCGVRVCPHRGAEVWALHAVAAVDPDPLAESGRPWMTWVQGQPEIRNGRVQLNDTPGFGVMFDSTFA